MSLCPEFSYREGLSDNEFWAHVYPEVANPNYNEIDDYIDLDEETRQTQCTICGSYGACGYDSEGRPLVHLEDDTD